MIEWVKNWANQIIVASIIAVIIEMLLPDVSSKKYIKMVIGIYVLFTIINPVITKVTGKSLDVHNFEFEKYFNNVSISTSTSTKKFEDNNSKLIKQAYIDNIENDIRTKIKQKGYEVTNAIIDIISDENSEKYGTITNIKLTLMKQNETDNSNNDNIVVNEIQVRLNNTNKNIKEAKITGEKITENEKLNIIEYLANEYSIDRTNITLN